MGKELTGQEIAERAYKEFSAAKNALEDPSPWHALFVDQSLPMDPKAKAAYLKDCSSWSRQFFLPIIRPLCRLAIVMIQVLKVVVPNFHHSPLLHYLIYLGQKYFVSPEANYVILRHFHVGSQILKFLSVNIENAKIELKSIRPETLPEIYKGEIYLNHDINLYNFIIQLNESLREQNCEMKVKAELDFSMLTEDDFGIKGLRDTWLNFIDVESAIELYTPMFQFLLKDKDFWRAHHSLQFDETIAIYVAKIFGNANHLGLVNNKHPMAPMAGQGAAYRLVLHGLSSELLHGLLNLRKLAEKNPTIDVPLKYPMADERPQEVAT